MEKMGATTNALNWFEIPMLDVNRTKAFYETIFDIEMYPMEMMGMEMLMFPTQGPKSGGALVKSPDHKPSTSGALIYLNANPDLQIVLDKVEAPGGKITLQKTLVNPETGYMAFIEDTEGNVVGLHSGN